MNLFDLPDAPLNREWSEILLHTQGLRIERIVDAGQTSDWYDQPKNELVFLLQGLAHLEFEDGRLLALKAGDQVLLEAHRLHRVAYTSTQPPCIWLCVFYPEGTAALP